MRVGRVFITGGPIIQITVNGKAAGDTVRLPAGGGSVDIRAELSSPQPPSALQLIHNGREVVANIRPAMSGTIHRWSIEQRLTVTESGWIAAAGVGPRIKSQGFDAKAHTGVVRVLVDDKPIRIKDDLMHLVALLDRQREHYRKEGIYPGESDRDQALSVFARARAVVQGRWDEIERGRSGKSDSSVRASQTLAR